MKKIYLLLSLLCGSFLLQAQNAASVNFTYTIDAGINKVTFTNTSTSLGDGIKKAYWTFGDGTSGVSGSYDGTFHYYANAGTYQVCLKIYRYTSTNDSTLIGSECKSVVIQQTCTAGFQWADSAFTSAAGRIIKFYGFGHNNANKVIREVCWNFGDGTDTCVQATASSPATSLLNISHRYTQSGTYTVCIKIKYDGGCVAEKCNVVVVNAGTLADSCAANFTIQPVTATPLGRKFIAQPWHNRQKKPVRICWTFGDNKDTCIQYPAGYTGDYWVEHKYAQYGQYEVCTNIKYDGGCEKKKCSMVTINQVISPNDTCHVTINENATNVSNRERKFYVGLQSGRVAEKICWNFGDGSDTCIILTNPLSAQQLMVTHLYATPGNYNVCVKVTYAGGCIAQRCKLVEIRLPQTNLCGGYMTDSSITANTIRFKGFGITNPNDYVVSYTWTFGDGTTGSGQQVQHVYNAPGNYSVCLNIRSSAGCETKICKRVSVAGNLQPQLILSPNSVGNTLTALFHSLLQQSLSVKIYNANGLMVRSYTRSAVTGANTWTFDVGALPTGVYTVIVQSANQFATGIFFKQ